MTTSTPQTPARIFNFSAGPAILPEEVLLEARDNLLSLGNLGMGILEISHRAKEFEAIMNEAEQNLRELLGLVPEQKVLFLHGGATLQFSMVPMNLLAPGGTADYVVTGEWSKKAVIEAQRVGQVHLAGSSEGEQFRRIPRSDELRFSLAVRAEQGGRSVSVGIDHGFDLRPVHHFIKFLMHTIAS